MIETLAQSDMEDKEIEMELEKFSLPIFGDSPGGSPSITPPSGQASPRRRDQSEVRVSFLFLKRCTEPYCAQRNSR